MTNWNALRAPVLGIALAALAVASVQTAAAEISIIGKWQIVEAVPAPWSKPEEQAELAAEGKRMLKTEVTFAPGSVNSKFKPFNCKSKVLYEATRSRSTRCSRAICRSPIRLPRRCGSASRAGTSPAWTYAVSKHSTPSISAIQTPR